jgi:glycosyltransferase involved in cell wall biosynthesis
VISLISPSRNNLKYLKWSYASVRKNLGPDIEYCVADDFSNDGTWEWCVDMMIADPNFHAIRNNGPKRLGHTILYDRLINEVATKDIVMIWHADMYAVPGMDKEILKHIKPGIVVSVTRIEPPLHPEGPEKIVMDFGTEPETFNEGGLLRAVEDLITASAIIKPTTEGIFAPWAIFKKDFQAIGGHDPLYAPQSKEDSDIFNRFVLAGYKTIQTWGTFVYHMTCRGSRFNPTLTTVGKESPEWLAHNIVSSRNFIRKWGTFVRHDKMMKPIIPHKYNIAFQIKNCNEHLLRELEPYCSNIFVDCNYDRYIQEEQVNTLYDLKERVQPYNNPIGNDIIVSFDATQLDQHAAQFLVSLPDIITDSGQVGHMAYSIFDIQINAIKFREHELTTIKTKYN